MPASKLWQRGMVLTAVVLGAFGILGAVLLLASAASGGLLSASPRGEGTHDTEFQVAGDGPLSKTAPQLRPPREPLSSAERGYAVHLARAAMPAGAQDVLGDPGGEVLAADLPPLAERPSARLVNVAVYDDSSDELHQMRLDLNHRKVLSDLPVQQYLGTQDFAIDLSTRSVLRTP